MSDSACYYYYYYSSSFPPPKRSVLQAHNVAVFWSCTLAALSLQNKDITLLQMCKLQQPLADCPLMQNQYPEKVLNLLATLLQPSPCFLATRYFSFFTRKQLGFSVWIRVSPQTIACTKQLIISTFLSEL